MDIDDNESIASTVENDVGSDFEWPVKQILAEGLVAGETKFLVEWENFPLSEASWEPKENIQEGLLQDWAQVKQRQENGEIPSFHIDAWRIALISVIRERYARHRERNLERRHRGLDTVLYGKTLSQVIAEINVTPSDQTRITGHNTRQPVPALAPQPVLQSTKVSGRRPHRSSIDELFSDSSSEMEAGVSSAVHDPTDEVGVTMPKQNADSVCVEDVVVEDITQQAENSQQIFADIAIGSSGDIPSKGIIVSHGSNMLMVGHVPDTESDLGSDAMEIGNGSGKTSPIANSSPAVSDDLRSFSSNCLRSETPSTSEGCEVSSKATRAAATTSLQREDPENVKEQDEKDLKPFLAAWPNKNETRVFLSLTPALKDISSSQAESSLFVPDRPHGQLSSSSNSKTRSLIRSKSESNEGEDGRERGSNRQSLPKTCVIGSIALECLFEVSSRTLDAQMTLFETFLGLDILNFSHVCTAQDFLRQFRATELSSGDCFLGTACSVLQSNKLETIVEYLHSSSFGLLCHHYGFCIVIYPNISADWQLSPLLPTSASPEGHLLRYLAFTPASNFRDSDMSLEYSPSYASGIELFDKQLYQRLLPTNHPRDRTQPTTDSFFLIFPPSAKPEEDLLCRWLRLFNRNCDVRSCAVPGHWAKFSKGARGAVILHQDCIQLLHRLPHFSKLLHSRNEYYNFWIFRLPFCSSFSEPQDMDQYMDQVSSALDWAFPPGLAVMATPSFFVSQPIQAYNLLKWVWKNFSAEAAVRYHGTVVVCHDIDSWLLSLMSEKKDASLGVQESKQILEVRSKTYMLMKMLLLEDDEIISSPVVQAPVFIDGNDEQSLVNWFGWWTASQVDKFRKFSVICSDNDDVTRLSRYIERSSLRSKFLKAERFRDMTSNAERMCHKLVPSDTLEYLSMFITGVSNETNASSWSPLSICPWPIHQHEGSSQCGDASLTPQSIDQREGGFHQREKYSSGVFYMPDDAHGRSDTHDVPLAHPWVAFLRPMELPRKPWGNTELLIWDYRLRDVVRQSQIISESDLLPLQRNLIAEVTKKYAKINLPLGKVWAGGFKASKMYSHPLDITLDWMKAAATSVKSWLPLNHEHMLNRGWSLVRNRSLPSLSHSTTWPRYAASDTAEALANDAPEEAIRILFDPPNASLPKSTPRNNSLYQWAMAERVQRGSQYTYVPTLEWYEEQQKLGQGFEHIRVLSWRSFFEHYKIADPEK